ncbi:MAG: enoyl-CoA hydratase/isomerase family protein [Gemmatimonadota bacterium]
MSTEHLRLERSDGVVRLILDRPPLNVLDIPMLERLEGTLARLADDSGVKLLVLQGAGRAFCAGVDVADHTAERVELMLETFHRVLRRLLVQEFPVLAVVRGAALGGGCELLLACDAVVAAASAKIGFPEIQLGVFPPVAAALLPRLIGRQRALDLILTGRVMSAEEAREMGLVSRVVSGEELDRAAQDYVDEIASLSGPVVRLTKRTVVEGLELPWRGAIERAEGRYLDELMRLEDPHEGLAAFLEKRRPVWRDA